MPIFKIREISRAWALEQPQGIIDMLAMVVLVAKLLCNYRFYIPNKYRLINLRM